MTSRGPARPTAAAAPVLKAPLTQRVRPELFFVGSAIFHYLGPAFAVLLFVRIDPLGVAWLRILSAGIVFALWRRPWRAWATANPAERRTVIVWGALLALMNASFYLAIDQLPLGTVAAIEFAGPILIAAIALRSIRNVAALAVAVTGVAALAEVSLRGSPSGFAFAIINMALFTGYIVIAHRVSRHKHLAGVDGLAMAMLIAAVFALPIGIVDAAPAFTDPIAIGAAIGVGVASSVIPYVFDQLAMRRLARATYALMVALLPATATVIGVVVLTQIPTLTEILGVTLVVAAVALHRDTEPEPAPSGKRGRGGEVVPTSPSASTQSEGVGVQALVVDPLMPLGLRLADVAEPEPRPDEVVLEVRHASLNYGDLMDARSGRLPPGAVLGSDAAGVVVRPAANGRGPAAGARVVAMIRGAFARRGLAAVNSLAEVPDSVDLATAAALPVAGVAALRTLQTAGPLLGKRVLITGASGGVGRFAVQLAALGGAHVIASVGSAVRGEGLAEAGADQVVVGLDGVDQPVDVVLDNVGGPQLVAAWELLAPGGSLQSIGWTSGEPAVFPPYATIGPPKSLTSFLIDGDVGADLSTLVGLVASRTLTVEIGWRGHWERVADAADALRGRRVSGKAVLDLEEGGT